MIPATSLTVCRVCTHGALDGETLSADGTCPMASVATAENHRAADERLRREVGRLTRGPLAPWRGRTA